jgi:Trk-type K+ transport system membrane component
VDAIASRVQALGGVNLGDANTKLNPVVPTMFAVVTLIFVIVVVAVRLTNRAEQVEEARRVFIEYVAVAIVVVVVEVLVVAAAAAVVSVVVVAFAAVVGLGLSLGVEPAHDCGVCLKNAIQSQLHE